MALADSEVTAVAVLNGTPPGRERLRELARNYPVYAADGGAGACAAAEVEPAWVVGDFDSVARECLPDHWSLIRDPDQNYTDFEKLIRRLPPDLRRLIICGGFGDRFDHVFNNLILAAALPHELRVEMESDSARLWRITPETPFTRNFAEQQLISLLPMGEVSGVEARGLQWPLQDACLGLGHGIAQSNRATGPVDVRVRQGVLFLWAECPTQVPCR
ncbi:MAG: thiamine diphosphokinase [Verrucomicrobia bacterium]|nr:thiamine diphosphokinase [Verrucomicrobiota bacterium]MCH8511437.1 thiamine diphosphokinase [Kiritimatiellia bacterium]